MTASLTVIGSGTLVPSPDRGCACHLVERDGLALLLDSGPGAVHGLARHGRPWWNVSHLVLTHYHADHFADLPHLLFALKWAAPSQRIEPLRIVGPPGLRSRAEALRDAYGDFIFAPGFPLTYEEVARDGTWGDRHGSVELHFKPTRHTDSSMAVRVELGGSSVGYTGDTGPDRSLGDFFRGVDILISECSYADPSEAPGHLSPASVADMARRARPGTLVLTHLYPPLEADSVPSLVREAGFAGRVVSARDGQRFSLGKA